MATGSRQDRRKAARQAAKAAKRQPTPAQQAAAAQQTMKQIGDLGTYINGFRNGFIDGYFQALADLGGSNVVKLVASQILAVHHDPEEQARYVLDKFQRAMKPKNLDSLREGLDRAVGKHLQEKGILPPIPAQGEQAAEGAADADAA